MLRTIEISMVVLILAVAYVASAFFASLPSPRQIASPNLRQLALTTLTLLDNDNTLSETSFKPLSDKAWADLEKALAASLPPNLVYNLTVYDVARIDNSITYRRYYSTSNSESGFGTHSEAASYLVTSPNATFSLNPRRVSATLYILNCSDANGWWITGYAAQSLALDLSKLLSPYFNTTVIVQDTSELGQLLDGNTISNSSYESIQNAVVINAFGEAVPIPSTYADSYPRDNYAEYCYEVGKRVNQYNWTWVSIVGYPFYYVSNTVELETSQNSWGIYGMRRSGQAGLNSFLQGLDIENHPSYAYDESWITGSPGVVYFTEDAFYYSNYYGIYPSSYQTATRALPSSIQAAYHTTIRSSIFQPAGGYYGAATFKHEGTGAFTAIGLTRTPDIRIAALALLAYYNPIIYKAELTLSPGETATQRLLVLQLSQQGAG